jgi:regulation of enolase protein 1 (concanavalin A-like superfamily)
VFVGGTATGVSVLLPEAASATSWASAGSNATAPAFTDTLTGTSIDNRWALVGTSTSLAPSASGLRLLSGSGGATTLLQTALSGHFSLSVYVMPPARAAGQAGLVLYTDDADWLSLLVNQSGRVSLCMEVWQQTIPCDSLQIAGSSIGNGVWLRIERQGSEFTGAVSFDTVTWRPVHSLVLNGGSATAIAGTEPASSLAFTTWGIMSAGSFSESSAPGFRDFSVTSGAS